MDSDGDLKSIGELIRYYRKRDGKTQKQVALWLGRDHTRIHRLESGELFPENHEIESFLQPGHLRMSDEERQLIWQVYNRDANLNYKFKTTANLPKPSEGLQNNSLDELAPFVIGTPITHPKQFFGRTKELKQIFNSWKSFPMQNIAVVGKRRSGKTSLLNYLQRITTAPANTLRSEQVNDWLPHPERYRWIYVNFQEASLCAQENLFRYLLDSLRVTSSSPCTLNQFCERVREPLKENTLILLDEISEALISPDIDERFWTSLRALACDPRLNLAFVITTHKPINKLFLNNDRSSPFLNIFRSIDLGPFSEIEAKQLLANSPIPFSPDDTTWMIEKSQRWPALLQLLAQIRLDALENEESDESWKDAGVRRIADYPHLFES
jgi:transcriptional regulator with XRE-family HTH domain